MGRVMGWPRHQGPDDLDRILDQLPARFVVRAIGAAWFVLGPTGAHVVALDDGTDAAPRALAMLASVTRSALAEHVAWVPYVDAFLVTERERPCPPATRVPPRLVRGSLINGPAVLAPTDLSRLVGCVEAGVLDGLTTVAPGPARRTAPSG